MSPHPDDPRSPAPLVEAGLYASEWEALQHATVILAMREDCWLEPSVAGWRLLIPPTQFARARRQLDSYDRESLRWPPPEPPPLREEAAMDYTTALFWVLVVTAVFLLQRRLPGVLEQAGCMDEEALFQRLELWRPFTALFLHADFGHLTANALSGFFIFATLRTSFASRGQAWGLLLVSACVANVLAGLAWLGEGHRSLGASTAVFAALGLLAGRALRHLLATHETASLRRLIVPVASAAALLALFGSGGVDTDLTAHLAGLLCGGVAGALPRTHTAALPNAR